MRFFFVGVASLALLSGCTNKPSAEHLCSSPETFSAVQNAFLLMSDRFITKASGSSMAAEMKPKTETLVAGAKFANVTVEKFNEGIGRAECNATVRFEGKFDPNMPPAPKLREHGASISDTQIEWPVSYSTQKQANGPDIVVSVDEVSDLVILSRNALQLGNLSN